RAGRRGGRRSRGRGPGPGARPVRRLRGPGRGAAARPGQPPHPGGGRRGGSGAGRPAGRDPAGRPGARAERVAARAYSPRPRSEGIWDEVREEIRQSLFNDGAAAQEAQGEYGPELHARVRTPDGLTDLRFVGIDGPRWMVRGVYQGAAATDPAAAGPLRECLDGLVVDRGQEAKPVREPLPLRLPREVADQAGPTVEA
ncbi:LOW QUALITY PROTEIN: hypothetical protein MCAG_04470, partial [Micromonospora sp. ATCC 39149]